jgi:hypothetical protein
MEPLKVFMAFDAEATLLSDLMLPRRHEMIDQQKNQKNNSS